MSKTSVANLSTQFSGDGWPNAQPWVSGPIVNTPSPANVQTVLLASAATTAVPVPPTALWVRLTASPSSSIAKQFKTVSGDVGSYFTKTQSFIFVFDQANMPANIYITLGTIVGGENIDIEFG